MSTCSECRFFSDLGRCRNGAARRSDVGFFQKACDKFLPPPQEANQEPTKQPQTMEKETKIAPAETEAPKTKTCRECGRELPLENFPKQVKSKDGHMNMCRDCFSAKHNHPKANTAPVPSVKEKTLADFTVDAICAELRRRGFSGSLTHTVTIEL